MDNVATVGNVTENAGLARQHQLDSDGSIKLCARMISQLFTSRATMQMRLEEWTKALPDLQHAIDIDPDNAEAYYHRSMVYQDLEEPDQAYADLQKAVKLDPLVADSTAPTRLEAGYRVVAFYTATGSEDIRALEVYPHTREGLQEAKDRADELNTDDNARTYLDDNYQVDNTFFEAVVQEFHGHIRITHRAPVG